MKTNEFIKKVQNKEIDIVDYIHKVLEECKKINKEYQAQYEQFRDKLAPIYKNLKAEESKDVVDYVRIKEILTQRATIRVDLFLATIHQFQDIKAILTPDQKEKFNAFKNHGREDWMKRGSQVDKQPKK